MVIICSGSSGIVLASSPDPLYSTCTIRREPGSGGNRLVYNHLFIIVHIHPHNRVNKGRIHARKTYY